MDVLLLFSSFHLITDEKEYVVRRLYFSGNTFYISPDKLSEVKDKTLNKLKLFDYSCKVWFSVSTLPVSSDRLSLFGSSNGSLNNFIHTTRVIRSTRKILKGGQSVAVDIIRGKVVKWGILPNQDVLNDGPELVLSIYTKEVRVSGLYNKEEIFLPYSSCNCSWPTVVNRVRKPDETEKSRRRYQLP